MRITKAQARRIGDRLKVDWGTVDIEEFRRGIEVESEHRAVVGNSKTKWARIALDHLKEFPNYYSRLKIVESRRRL